jgi:hypothetical protein
MKVHKRVSNRTSNVKCGLSVPWARSTPYWKMTTCKKCLRYTLVAKTI